MIPIARAQDDPNQSEERKSARRSRESGEVRAERADSDDPDEEEFKSARSRVVSEVSFAEQRAQQFVEERHAEPQMIAENAQRENQPMCAHC